MLTLENHFLLQSILQYLLFPCGLSLLVLYFGESFHEGVKNSPGKDIESYLSSVHSIPIRTKEEEQELALKLYEEDDLDAARQLVIHHLRFVVHIARSYQGYGLPLGDIIQEGNVGLMKAVDKYDPHRGVKLVSFAVHWIKAEIHEYILKNWRLVKIATTKAQRKLFFNLRSKIPRGRVDFKVG